VWEFCCTFKFVMIFAQFVIVQKQRWAEMNNRGYKYDFTQSVAINAYIFVPFFCRLLKEAVINEFYGKVLFASPNVPY
jgi:hypothetical protein